MSLTEQDIVLENTRLYQLCSSIIALNAPSMIEEMNPDELYKIACRDGPGSLIAIKKLKEIYPDHKMTNETIHERVKDYYTGEMKTSYQRCGAIEFWDVSEVTDMNKLFMGFCDFNGDLSRWSVSSVTDMSYMFHSCKVFNSDISKWNVRSVTNMTWMFHDCNNFDSDISKWSVSSVTTMAWMFFNCYKFNRDISEWDVSSVNNMMGMFFNCNNFNRDLSMWTVSSVKTMYYMFNNNSLLLFNS